MRTVLNLVALAATLTFAAPFGGGTVISATLVAQDAGTAPNLPAVVGGEVKCADGKAKGYECQNVDLLSFLPAAAIGGTNPMMYGSELAIIFNGLWGWIDSTTGREFAIIGTTDGASFIEVTDPVNPKYLGKLPLHEGAQPSFWRDIKVYKNHAFIIADAAGDHGMQVFDLTQLRDVKNPPATFKETAHYDNIASAHTLALNEATGFAYPTGANGGGETCGGALHMIDVHTPTKPTFVGCYAEPKTGSAGTGYTHETVCVVYHGPDQKYKGHEICVNSSETAVGIADVTDKKNPKTISIVSYPNVSYAHQGWLSEDQRYFFLDDEGDEEGSHSMTRTIVFDFNKLDDPVVATEFFGTTHAIDHNLYVRGPYVFEANYKAGLRVLDASDPVHPKEVGYFDTTPGGENDARYGGTWTNYPYFKTAKDGVVALSSISEGLFLVRFRPPK
jgi:choice-of-anchor B domain-containing protein